MSVLHFMAGKLRIRDIKDRQRKNILRQDVSLGVLASKPGLFVPQDIFWGNLLHHEIPQSKMQR